MGRFPVLTDEDRKPSHCHEVTAPPMIGTILPAAPSLLSRQDNGALPRGGGPFPRYDAIAQDRAVRIPAGVSRARGKSQALPCVPCRRRHAVIRQKPAYDRDTDRACSSRYSPTPRESSAGRSPLRPARSGTDRPNTVRSSDINAAIKQLEIKDVVLPH